MVFWLSFSPLEEKPLSCVVVCLFYVVRKLVHVIVHVYTCVRKFGIVYLCRKPLFFYHSIYNVHVHM